MDRPASRHKAKGLAALAATLVGVLMAVVTWIEPTPSPPLFACWSSHLHTPLVADYLAAANDRDMLESSGCFSDNTSGWTQGLTAEQLQTEWASHAQADAAPGVIYLSAYATRRSDGEVLLMMEDYDPYHATGGVPLKDLLDQLPRDDTPRLLVLDLSWNLSNGQAGLLPCGVGQRLHEQLASYNNPGLLTLVSCSPGEASTTLAGVGRTTFGYFFESGLLGAADGYNPAGLTDGRVTAQELSAYVANRVAAWTTEHGPTLQTPRLYAPEGVDWVLGSTRSSGATAAVVSPVGEYPTWLHEAWSQRDAWVTGSELHTTPRLIKRYEAELLDAENRWRAGGEPESLLERLTTNCGPLLREHKEAQARLATSPQVSLAQWEQANGPSDPAMVAAWSDWFAAKDPTKQAAAFEKATTEASYPALALAATVALADAGERFEAALTLVGEELRRRSAEPRFLEVAALESLELARAYHPGIASADLEALYLTELLKERVWTYARVMAWDGGLISKADQAHQTARALLASPGYASSDDAVRWNERADRLYRAADARLRVFRRAVVAHDLALAELPELIRVVRLHPMLQDDWDRAAAAAKRLSALLYPEKASGSHQAVDAVDSLTTRLEQLLETLAAPTGAAAIEQLITDIRAGDCHRRGFAEALLATPLIQADLRMALASAIHESAQTLIDPLERFAKDRRRSTLLAAMAGPSPVLRNNRAGHQAAALEDRLTEAVLHFAEEPSQARALERTASTGAAPTQAPELARLTALRSALVNVYEADYSQLSPAVQNTACRVLAATTFNRTLDQRAMAPTLVSALERRDSWAQAYADRLLRESNDPGRSPLLAEVARRLSPGAPQRDLSVAAVGGSPDSPLVLEQLSTNTPSQALDLRVEAKTTGEASIDVFQPAGCLEVAQAATTKGAATDARLTFHLRTAATPSQQIATHGALLRVAQGASVVHRRVDTPAVSDVAPVALYVEFAGVRLPFSRALELPPTDSPTALRLIAVNQTEQPLDLTAQVVAGDVYDASLQLTPHGEAPLGLVAGAPKAGGAPAAPASPAWSELPAITVTLRSGEKTLLTRTAQLGVADPRSYVRVRDARVIVNSHGKRTLRLSVERLGGAPEKLNIDWSLSAPTGEPAPLVLGGTLSATLTEDRPTATLEATLQSTPEEGETVLATAKINGVEGALAWRSDAPATAQTVTLTPSDQPVIRIDAPNLVAAGEPLDSLVHASPTPTGATLEVIIDTATGPGDASINAYRHHKLARRHTVVVGPKLAAGGLLLKNTIGPWSEAYDTVGLVGRRRVVATVFDKDGVELAKSWAPVTIDGDPATIASLTGPAAPIAGKPARFEIEASDNLSGVSQVTLYAGTPIDGAPPAGAKPVTAARDPSRPGVWVGTLPLPAGVPSVAVTAEVTNGVKLTQTETIVLTLTSAEAASLGRVVGAVTEGTRPQPGVVVELRTPKQQPIAKSKTDNGGRYHFNGVKPGAYLIWSTKPASQRVGAVAIEVKPGAASQADVQLSL